MGFLDRILGNETPAEPNGAGARAGRRESGMRPTAMTADEQALERYRYMIKTAPPETIEQAHAEAFARLTPEQRRMVLGEMSNAQPAAERAAAQNISPDDPQAMGRLATRTEMRQPGFMERTLGGGGGGLGLGGTLLASFAMGFAGSMIANSFFSSMEGGGGFGGHDAPPDQDVAGEAGDDVDHTEADQTLADDTGGDFGGDGMDDFGGGGDFDV